MPPFSARRPVEFVRLLFGNRHWVIGFAAESAGWIVYVIALRLAPLSLVQAVSASGIAILAFISARGHPGRLARREQLAVVLAVTGLVLLSLSLVGTEQSDHEPDWKGVAVWIGATAAGAGALAGLKLRLARGPALGLAAGLLFATGDMSAKLVTYGGLYFLALLSLIAAYALGTSILQAAYQHGSALTTAGLATLATNAVPIAAGFVVFGEKLPEGAKGVVQIAAFASLVVSAVCLGRGSAPSTKTHEETTGAAEAAPSAPGLEEPAG